MAFRIQEARGTISGQASAVRAENIDVSQGGQQVAQALAGLGKSAIDVGLRFDRIEAETQLSESQRLASEEINRLALSFSGNLNPDTYQAEFSKSLAKITKLSPKNKRAAHGYKIWLNAITPAWSKGIAKAQIVKQEDNWLAELFKKQTSAELAGDTGGFAEYLAAGISEGLIDRKDAAKILSQTRITAQYNRGIKSLEADPATFLAQIDNLEYLPSLDAVARAQLKSAARQVIARNKRNAAEQKLIAQEQTARQLLADFWEGKLTDPQKITDAVRKGYLSDTDGKYLRKALLNPEPRTLNLKNLAEVKQAIVDVGIGVKTKAEAMEILYKNLGGIDPTTGKSLVTEIFGTHDKGNSEMKREGRSLMEDLIRDKDPISGFFTDDERQILGTSEAILVLDKEIEKAAKKGKPLERREILIKAVGIGQQIKNRIKKEEEEGSLPELKFSEVEGEVTRPEFLQILSEATVPTLTVYRELSELKPIWKQLSRSEKLQVYKDIAGGIPAESILGQYKDKVSKSPYPEYPDAFLENGKWKVMRDGKKYRIEE